MTQHIRSWLDQVSIGPPLPFDVMLQQLLTSERPNSTFRTGSWAIAERLLASFTAVGSVYSTCVPCIAAGAQPIPDLDISLTHATSANMVKILQLEAGFCGVSLRFAGGTVEVDKFMCTLGTLR